MSASRRAGDRLASCPTCARDVRVTDDELTVGRSFCAACGERFLVEHTTIGDSPLRALALIEVHHERAPDTRMAVRPDGAIDLYARSASRRTLFGLGMAASCAGMVALALSNPQGVSVVTLLGLPGVAAAAWSALASRERVLVEGDTLVVATGPLGLRRRRFPVRDLEGVTIEPGQLGLGSVVTLTLRGRGRVSLGTGFRLTPQSAERLKARLTELIRHDPGGRA